MSMSREEVGRRFKRSDSVCTPVEIKSAGEAEPGSVFTLIVNVREKVLYDLGKSGSVVVEYESNRRRGRKPWRERV